MLGLDFHQTRQTAPITPSFLPEIYQCNFLVNGVSLYPEKLFELADCPNSWFPHFLTDKLP